MTVLVTGATGNVGAAAVSALRARGVVPRAFVRDAARAAERLGDGVELAVGDFGDEATVAAALAGVDRVLLSSGDGPQKVEHERTVVDACAAAGVGLVVKASTAGADPDSPLPALAWNARGEEHLRRSGLPAVILASSWYMTNLLADADEVRQGRLVGPAGEGRIAMIDPRDVGAVAAAVLAGDGHEGRRYTLTGPRAVSFAEVAEALSQATGAPVEYVDVPEQAAREALAAAGLPGWLVEQIAGAFRLIREEAQAETTGAVRALAGRDPHDVAQFARDHAAAFGPALSAT